MGRWSRPLAAAALLLILAGGFEPLFIKVFFLDRDMLRAHLVELPYRKLPGYRQLLLAAREQTSEGESIGIWIPAGRWNEGYEYAYYRAAYPLAGRRVLPLLDRSDRVLTQNLSRVDSIVCWRCEPPFPGFRVVHRSDQGVLARR